MGTMVSARSVDVVMQRHNNSADMILNFLVIIFFMSQEILTKNFQVDFSRVRTYLVLRIGKAAIFGRRSIYHGGVPSISSRPILQDAVLFDNWHSIAVVYATR